MSEHSITRAAAIIYADENANVNTITTHRKIIEAIFIDNNNKPSTVDQIIDQINDKLKLTFLEEEIELAIARNSKGYFEIKVDKRLNKKFINLTEKRVLYLKEKDIVNNVETYIQKFIEEVYTGKINKIELENILYRFIYELLNKNILAFRKITSSKFKPDEISINPNIFKPIERGAINEFLSWENVQKNKAIFILISYSVEYSLLSNNISSNNLLMHSIRNKEFYLDNNVIYRAIGINGEDRKNRTLTFLKKCTDSGQRLLISKYTRVEFTKTIQHHINQLQKFPFRKINPALFKKYSVNPSIYEFYHNWRDKRATYSFDLFSAHLYGLYENFKTKFDVKEDFNIPYDEKEEEIVKKIDEYKNEIQEFKKTSYEDSHLFDAQNMYFVESKRQTNNFSITDTKFYFVSTDQKLRNWDFKRNDNQPLALLPTQWMTILLKYINRSDDDFKSFVSFLKLKQEDSIIQEDNLQIVLSGISEITEDFEKQTAILDKMVENKFEGILDNSSGNKTRENAVNFTQKTLEEQVKTLEGKVFDINEHSQKTIQDKQNEFNAIILQEYIQSLKSLKNQRDALANLAEKKIKNIIRSVIFSLVFIFISLVCLIIKYSWDVMEPIIYLIGLAFVFGGYIYVFIKGESFNPLTAFKKIHHEIEETVFVQHSFDFEREKFLENEIAKLTIRTEK